MRRVPGTVTKSRWVLKTKTEKFSHVECLQSWESVSGPRCISGSGGVSKPVETEYESVVGLATAELKLVGASTGPSNTYIEWDNRGVLKVLLSSRAIVGCGVEFSSKALVSVAAPYSSILLPSSPISRSSRVPESVEGEAETPPESKASSSIENDAGEHASKWRSGKEAGVFTSRSE
ncbi:hypothetical protein LXL04_019723 [Taraxacum kok-saghyz]